MIYQLSEGVGRTRGQKQGGLRKHLLGGTALSQQESSPLFQPTAVRVQSTEQLKWTAMTQSFLMSPKTATELYSNYGFAGKEFVEHLMEEGSQECVQKLQEAMQDALKTNDTMDKQTASARAYIGRR